MSAALDHVALETVQKLLADLDAGGKPPQLAAFTRLGHVILKLRRKLADAEARLEHMTELAGELMDEAGLIDEEDLEEAAAEDGLGEVAGA